MSIRASGGDEAEGDTVSASCVRAFTVTSTAHTLAFFEPETAQSSFVVINFVISGIFLELELDKLRLGTIHLSLSVCSSLSPLSLDFYI